MRGIFRRTLVVLLALLIPAGMVWSAGQGEGAASTDDEIITVTLVTNEHPSSPIDPEAPKYRELTRRTGIRLDIEAVPSSDYSTKRNLMLATGQMPDILRVDIQQAQDFADSGVMMPLMDMIDEHAPNLQSMIEQVPAVQRVMLDNELWYVPIWDVRKKMNAPVPMIRRDLLDELGLDMPNNFDELFTALQAMKEAYPDSQPWTNRSGTRNLLNRAAYPMGVGYNIYYDKDIGGGQWVYGTIRPEFSEVLEYFNRAYEEGVLDPDFAVNTSDQWHQKLGSGKSFFYYDNMTFSVNYTIALRGDNPDAAFWPVPVMENDQGRRNNFFYPRSHLQSGYAIGADTDYPEEIIELFDWMASPEGFEITNWGIPGETFEKNGQLFSTPRLLYEYEDPGFYEHPQSVLDQYANASDPQRAMRAGIGTGLLQFTILVDQKPIYYFDPPLVNDWYVQLEQDPGMLEFVREPPFTADERERLKQLRTDVDNILLPALDQVIIGEMSLQEFANVQTLAIDAGAVEIEEIYNTAEQRMLANQ